MTAIELLNDSLTATLCSINTITTYVYDSREYSELSASSRLVFSFMLMEGAGGATTQTIVDSDLLLGPGSTFTTHPMKLNRKPNVKPQ